MAFGFFQTRVELQSPKRGRVRKTKADPTRATLPVAFYRERGCAACTFNATCGRMKASGAGTPIIYVLGEAPGEEEMKIGRQFVGESGQLLRNCLPDQSICRFNNTIRTRPPKNRTPLTSEIESCRKWIEKDIAKSKPTAILAVGATALAWCIGESRITQWRGRRIPVVIGGHRCWVYPVLHPSYLLRQGAMTTAQKKEVAAYDKTGMRWGGFTPVHIKGSKDGTIFSVDITRAFNESVVGVPMDGLPVALGELYEDVELYNPKLGLGWIIKTLAEAGAAGRVALDLETSGLRPYAEGSQILTMAVATEKWTRAFPLDHPEARWTPRERLQLREAVKLFCCGLSAVKVAHNLTFELEWLAANFGEEIIAGKRWRKWECTQAQAYCLDERAEGQSLDSLCLERLGFRLKAQSKIDVRRLAQFPLEQVLKYNALDAKYTRRLDAIQQEEIVKAGLVASYRDHTRRIPSIVLMQRKGMPVDVKLARAYAKEYAQKLQQIKASVEVCAEARAYHKQYGSPFILEGTGSDDCLKRAFGHLPELKNEEGNFTTNETVFSRLKSELANLVLEHREYNKLKGTYIDPMLPGGALLYPDGRLHSNVNHTFTATGRLSMDRPNGQNFPKRDHAEVRKIIIPPAGHRIVSADYKQIEVCVIASVSNDKNLMKAICDRKDIHLKYAEMLAKLVPPFLDPVCSGDMKKVRSAIKSLITFPFFYGAAPSTAARHILGQVSSHSAVLAEKLTPKVNRVTEEIYDEFWGEYPGAKAWQNRLIKYYESHGYVETPTGRRRHGPMKPNELINMPIQGTASDIVVDGMVRLAKRGLREDRPCLVAALNIHDDLTFYVPEASLSEDVHDIVDMMLRPSYSWLNVPVGVEVSVGCNWHEQEVIGTFYSDEMETA